MLYILFPVRKATQHHKFIVWAVRRDKAGFPTSYPHFCQTFEMAREHAMLLYRESQYISVTIENLETTQFTVLRTNTTPIRGV